MNKRRCNIVGKIFGKHIKAFDKATMCDSNMSRDTNYVKKNYILTNLIKDNRGFIDMPVSIFFMAFFLFLLAFIIAVTMSLNSKAKAIYMWFDDSMRYAAQAANMDGDTSMTGLRNSLALDYFVKSFTDKVDGVASSNTITAGNADIIPGPVTIRSFTNISPGDSFEGGVAKQPGYIAVIEVPVFKGNLPYVGTKYIIVPMRSFGVVKSTKN